MKTFVWHSFGVGAVAFATFHAGCGDTPKPSDETGRESDATGAASGEGPSSSSGTPTGQSTLTCTGDSADDCSCHASDKFGDGTQSDMRCGSVASFCCATSDWPKTGDCSCDPAAVWACTATGTYEGSTCDCRWYDQYDDLPDDAIDASACDGQGTWETCCLDEDGSECTCFNNDINGYDCPAGDTPVASCDLPYVPSDDDCSANEALTETCNGS